MTTSAELLEQGKALMNVLQFQPAKRFFQQALQAEPQSVDARIWLARVSLIENRGDAQILDEALQLQPHNAEALTLKGVARMQEKDWEGAVALLKQAQMRDSKLPMIYFNLARSQRKLGNLEDAERAARTAIELDRDDFQAHSELSYILGKTGRVKEAAQEMINAIRVNPLFLKGYMVLGTLFKQAGKFDESIEVYREGLRHIPSALLLFEELCDVYAAKGDYMSAYRDAVVLISKRNDFRDYLRLGSYALAINQREKAEKAFRKSQTLNYEPERAQLYLKTILGTDEKLYNEADTLRREMEAQAQAKERRQ